MISLMRGEDVEEAEAEHLFILVFRCIKCSSKNDGEEKEVVNSRMVVAWLNSD